MEDQIAVTVKDLYKTFKLPLDNHSGIKQVVINAAKRKKGYELQQVLNGVSFEIKKGEFFGIVGRNGSGKSTLLKLLAGIYVPDKGLIQVNGSLTPFIELGVGFNPELTGYENVFLNGALLGFSRKEMEAMYGDIVSFAELEKFMDQKLKNYSSGMQVRLAFSIAIRAQSDILLLDEVLAVGDEAFQRKCYEYFENLKKQKQTVILVTHDMSAVESFCDRAILIDNGDIIQVGKSTKVAKAYRNLFSEPIEETTEQVQKDTIRWGEGPLRFASVNTTVSADSISIDMHINSEAPLSGKVIIAFTVKSRSGDSLFGASQELMVDLQENETQSITLLFNNILSKGMYYLDLSMRAASTLNYSDFWTDATTFRVNDKPENALHLLVDARLDGKTD